MGVDPGGTTGVVVWDAEAGRMVHVEEVRCGGSWREEVAVVRGMLEDVANYGVDVVIIEDFVLRLSPGGGTAGLSSARAGLSPVRIGFGLAMGLDVAGFAGEVVFQGASGAISVITNERLRGLGMYVKYPGGGEHVRDAARHVALWLRKRR